MKKNQKIIIILSIFAALSFWILAAFIDSVLYHNESFLNSLLLSKRQIAFRLLFSLCFVLFCVLIAKSYARHRDSEEALQKEVLERRKIEDALRESENFAKTIIETEPECVKLIAPDKTLLSMNRAGLAMIEADSLEQVKGQQIAMLVLPEHRQAFLSFIEEVFQGKSRTLEFEIVGLKGRRLWLESHSVPLRDKEGKIIALLGITRDITAKKNVMEKLEKEIEERRWAEEEIKKLNQDLLYHAAELEDAYKDLESFSYAASHDLRSPLITIQGFTTALLQDCADKLDDNERDLLKRVESNIAKMRQLIDDLLAFSRVTTKEIQKSEIDMEALTRRVFEEVRPAAADRIIHLKVNTLPSAYGDLSMIHQVLVNLLSNAIKFTSCREAAIIDVGGHTEINENIYYVRDNGVGFDTKYSHKLFALFQRIHSSKQFEGTGVGLVIAKKIIAKHGGRIWAEGKLDEGASFYFTLPTEQIGSRFADAARATIGS
jgi:PAS domain S-box-containing protein